MTTGDGRPSSLLEREAEIARLAGAIGGAGEGRGGLLLVEGVAGVGKSTILAHAREQAGAESFLILSARGDELERAFPFGLATQLLAEPAREQAPDDPELLAGAAKLAMPLLEGQAPGPAPSGDPSPGFPIMHGLHWLVAGLAERCPLLITVDDAHWADIPSLRFLVYLAQRIEGMPLAVLLSIRSGEAMAPEAEALLARLRDHPLSDTLSLAPLNEVSAQQLVAGELAYADAELGAAFHMATEGNPFLLRELLDAAREEGEVTAAGVGALRPESIRASILVRLGRLGEDARRLALAASVLGPAATVPLAGDLAGLDRDSARAAAESLSAADILRADERLVFAHPVVRETVYADLSVVAKRADHVRAARLLHDAHAPVEEVASHLMQGEPLNEEWAIEALREAASRASGRGDPATAVGLLRRALADAGREPDDPGLLLELGRAEMAIAEPNAIERLEAANAAAADPLQRAMAASAIGQARWVLGDSRGAFEAAREALDLVPPGMGGPPEAQLLYHSMSAGRIVPELVDEVTTLLDRRRADTDGAPAAAEIARRALLSFDAVLRGDRRRAGAEIDWAQTSIGGPDDEALLLPAPAGSVHGLCMWLLGRYEESQAIYDREVERARERGSLLELAVCLEGRIACSWARGDVNACLADVETLLGLNEEGWETATVPVRALAAEMLLERSDPDGARRILTPAEEVEPRLANTLGWYFLPYGRTHLAMASQDWAAAREQALETGERLAAAQIRSADYLPWRALAAFAAARDGRDDEALALAEEDLELAREIESPRATGAALATLGSIRGRDEGVEMLREAVAELDRTEAELEPARARLKLGIALRQARHPRDARLPLEEAIDSARRLGAVSLAERAMDELQAAGGRPRRQALSGVESLTPGQLRVAKMAAEGLSNREIAEALFVTRRTVETHLTQVYGKLEIGSREELPEDLGRVG
jgi:DNA-binding CsgD family transcriptional regulator